MATKRFYATRDLKNPSYGTRMLRAGDPVDLDGPKARLYLRLGAVSATPPAKARAPRPTDGQGSFTDEREIQPKPKAKAAPRKKAASKKPGSRPATKV